MINVNRQHLHTKDKNIRGHWITVSNSSRGSKEVSSRSINKNGDGTGRYATHDKGSNVIGNLNKLRVS